MTRQRRKPQEAPSAPIETEYLVTDMEKLVNERFDEYLDGYPYQVSISDFRPAMPDGKLPSGIRRIANTHVSSIAPGTREFAGIDIQMQFPVVPEAENPLNINFKWTDGIECRIAIVDRLPIILVESGDQIIKSELLQRSEMTSYLNSTGLPEGMWGSDINGLIADTNKSRDVKLRRSSLALVDPYTNMEFVHEMRLMRNDHGEKELVEELCLNIDHFTDEVSIKDDELYLPPAPTFRNMLRFERNDSREAWVYRGAYEGKLETGEFVDEIVQVNPSLGLPKNKVINKALNVLSHPPY